MIPAFSFAPFPFPYTSPDLENHKTKSKIFVVMGTVSPCNQFI